jgi:hypothetical protein
MRNNIQESQCPFCGNSDHTSFAFRRNGNTIHSCHGCGLEFLFPQPTGNTLSSLYSSSYFVDANNPESIRRQAVLKRATAKPYWAIILPFVQARNPKLLEIGALKPGRLLAVVTPSLNTWPPPLLGRYWMKYKMEHFTYFSRRSLGQLFEKAGFANIQFFLDYKVLSFGCVAGHFERFPISIVSPFVLQSVLPESLAHRPTRIAASGVTALAQEAR